MINIGTWMLKIMGIGRKSSLDMTMVNFNPHFLNDYVVKRSKKTY